MHRWLLACYMASMSSSEWTSTQEEQGSLTSRTHGHAVFERSLVLGTLQTATLSQSIILRSDIRFYCTM